jgi:hypothetical protein
MILAGVKPSFMSDRSSYYLSENTRLSLGTPDPLRQGSQGGGIDRSAMGLSTTDQSFPGVAVRPAAPIASWIRCCGGAGAVLDDPLDAVAAADNPPAVGKPDNHRVSVVALGQTPGL